MTKLEEGMRYEMQKLLKHSVFFIAGVAVFLIAIQLLFHAVESSPVVFGGANSFGYLFLMIWTIAFSKDVGFFLQSGLTRREVFTIFVLVIVAGALAFAFLDTVLSLVVSVIWREQSLFALALGSYMFAVFGQTFLVNLAVAAFALMLMALQRRIGTRWTALLFIFAFLLMTAVLPYFFSLFPGGIEAYAWFMAALMGSPYAPGMHFVFQAVVALACIVLTWMLLRRVNADRFAAGR